MDNTRSANLGPAVRSDPESLEITGIYTEVPLGLRNAFLELKVAKGLGSSTYIPVTTWFYTVLEPVAIALGLPVGEEQPHLSGT